MDYTIPTNHPNPALAGQTVNIYSRATLPPHGDVLHADMAGQHVILKTATNPEALRMWLADCAAIEARRAANRPTRDAMEVLLNEGGEGYGSPLNQSGPRDNTPYHKGDDQAE